MFRSGEEVQVKHLGLWEIGVFIQDNANGTRRIKIGRQSYDLPKWDVKPNEPAYQDDDVKDEKGGRRLNTRKDC